MRRHFINYFFSICVLVMAVPDALAQGQTKFSSSCENCAATIATLFRGLDEPNGIVQKETLEQLIGAPLVETITIVAAGRPPSKTYRATVDGPPHMVVSWSIGGRGYPIVLISFNLPTQHGEVPWHSTNCVLPTDLPDLTNSGWKLRGREDLPTHFIQEYQKPNVMLYLNYSPRYRCLKSMSLTHIADRSGVDGL